MTDPSSPASSSSGPLAQRAGHARVDQRPRGQRAVASLATRTRASRSDHPLVVTIDKRSAPRAVFCGDRSSRSTCPPARASSIRARRIDALKDVDAAIRYAINHPSAAIRCTPSCARG